MWSLKGYDEINKNDDTEWVIPAPHIENTFIGCKTGAEYKGAVVADGFDPDKTLKDLCNLYPGIPEKLLSFYIAKTVVPVCTSGLNLGDKLIVLCNSTSATLRNVSTDTIIPLWTDLDTTIYI